MYQSTSIDESSSKTHQTVYCVNRSILSSKKPQPLQRHWWFKRRSMKPFCLHSQLLLILVHFLLLIYLLSQIFYIIKAIRFFYMPNGFNLFCEGFVNSINAFLFSTLWSCHLIFYFFSVIMSFLRHLLIFTYLTLKFNIKKLCYIYLQYATLS